MMTMLAADSIQLRTSNRLDQSQIRQLTDKKGWGNELHKQTLDLARRWVVAQEVCKAGTRKSTQVEELVSFLARLA